MNTARLNPIALLGNISIPRRAAWLVGIMMSGQLLAFLCQIFLARSLGADSYGYYIYTLSWGSLLVVGLKLGQEQATLRFLPAYVVHHDWARAAAFFRWSTRLAGGVSVLAAVVAATLVFVFRNRLDPTFVQTALLGCLLLPAATLLPIFCAGLQARHRVISARLPETILRPLLLICGVFAVYVSFPFGLDARAAMVVHILAVSMLAVIAYWQCRRAMPADSWKATPQYEVRQWGEFSAVFLWIGGVPLVFSQLDVLILGIMTTPAEAAVYATARRIAVLITLGLMVANTLLASRISECHARGDHHQIQKLLRSASWLLLGVSIPLLLAVLLLGRFVLQLFGENFVQAYPALVILAVAQTANALCGSVGLILMMTGHQKFGAWAALFVCLLNSGLNLVLIPMLGILGAAWAFALSVVLQNILLVVYIRGKLGIYPTVFNLWQVRTT